MIPSLESNHSTLSFKEKMQFIKMKRRGQSYNELLNSKIEAKKETLHQKIQTITHLLMTEQQEFEQKLDQLTNRLESIDFSRGGALQCESLSQQISQLSNVQRNLEQTLKEGEEKLQQKIEKKKELLSDLHTLSHALKE